MATPCTRLVPSGSERLVELKRDSATRVLRHADPLYQHHSDNACEHGPWLTVQQGWSSVDAQSTMAAHLADKRTEQIYTTMMIFVPSAMVCSQQVFAGTTGHFGTPGQGTRCKVLCPSLEALRAR
eukprot:scaffold1054_cov366-Prasinococcus_capsulatus_cf.AAC.1